MIPTQNRTPSGGNMEQDRAEFAQAKQLQPHPKVQQQEQQNRSLLRTVTKQDCDILLNNFLIKKRRFRVLLKCNCVVWDEESRRSSASAQTRENSKNGERSVTSNVIQIGDIVAVTKGDSKNSASDCSSPNAQFITFHYAVLVIKSSTDCNRWRVRTTTFYNADVHVVQQWYAALTQRLASQCRVQRLLVFINPYGGRQQGLQVYERHCKPLFQLAGIDASCIISQHANQIRDILMSHDLAPYDGVCCVGGDGTVAEVINGLLFRGIRDNNMDERRPAYVPKPPLPIGIVPAGSTDTVAYSIHGTADVETAVIHLVLGQRRGLDICSVSNHEGILRFCASVLSYGYLGDVAAKSEKYRWMGTKRYEYAGVKAFLKNCGYEAEIRLLVSSDAHEHQQLIANDVDTICCANCQRCNDAILRSASGKVDFGNPVQMGGEKSCNPEGADRNENVQREENKKETVSNFPQQSQNSKNDLSYCNRETSKVFSSIYNVRSIENDCKRGKFCKRRNSEDCDKTYVIENQKHSITMRTSEDPRQNDYKATPCHSNAEGNTSSNETENSNEQRMETGTNSSTNVRIDNVAIDANRSSKEIMETTAQWKVIKGSFFMISGANIACACARSPNGISRYSHLGDGYLDLILVRKTSLLNNVRFVMNTMSRNGNIRDLPFVEVYRTRRFCFRSSRLTEADHSLKGSCQPISAADMDNDRISSWNCDGEVVSDLEIIMNSHCQLIDVFMRGPLPYDKDSPGARKSIICCYGAT